MTRTFLILLAAALPPAAFAMTGADPDAAGFRAKALKIIQRDFQPRGQAKLDRLQPDEVIDLCNQTGNKPPEQAATRLEQKMQAAVPYPADGNLMGDWKAGEKLAQNGRGFTWSDKEDVPAGGNCYNCHQISPKELSFGTLGPSLYQFGKLRGNSADVQKYAYAKIYNAKAFNLCSNMPRFGHVGALKEAQIKDLVALLLDPESPVNKPAAPPQ